MSRCPAHTTLPVLCFDEARSWFSAVLRCAVLRHTPMPLGNRRDAVEPKAVPA